MGLTENPTDGSNARNGTKRFCISARIMYLARYGCLLYVYLIRCGFMFSNSEFSILNICVQWMRLNSIIFHVMHMPFNILCIHFHIYFATCWFCFVLVLFCVCCSATMGFGFLYSQWTGGSDKFGYTAFLYYRWLDWFLMCTIVWHFVCNRMGRAYANNLWMPNDHISVELPIWIRIIIYEWTSNPVHVLCSRLVNMWSITHVEKINLSSTTVEIIIVTDCWCWMQPIFNLNFLHADKITNCPHSIFFMSKYAYELLTFDACVITVHWTRVDYRICCNIAHN